MNVMPFSELMIIGRNKSVPWEYMKSFALYITVCYIHMK